MAQWTVNSCTRFGYEVIQIADTIAPHLNGAELRRFPKDDGFHMHWRMCRFAELSGPFLAIDTDVLLAKPVHDVFDRDFDAALYKRKDNEEHPWNAGVMFVKNNEFVRDCADAMGRLPDADRVWWGEKAIKEVAPRYNVLDLNQSYNYSPHLIGEMKDSIHIYHLKGSRKNIMSDIAKRLGIR